MKQYVLQNARKAYDFSLKDVAFLAGIDTANLSRIERQVSSLPLSVALLYHRLFKVPMTQLCRREYTHISEQITKRAAKLINQQVADSSPKSLTRIQELQKIVQSITEEENGEE